MKIEYQKVDALIPYENNPRVNDGAVEAVAASIRENNPNVRIALVDDKYIVTSDGRAFSYWNNHKKWKEQKLRKHSNGYMRMTMNGKDVYLHRIVASLFCENPRELKEVNHIDGDKTNNDASNLEWCTRSENNKHAFLTGLRNYDELKKMSNSSRAAEARKKRRKLTFEQAVEIRNSAKSDRELSMIYGISRGCIWQIKAGKSYKHA